MPSTRLIGHQLRATSTRPDVSPEVARSVATGLAVHLGPALAFIAWCAWTDLDPLAALVGFIAINVAYWLTVRKLERDEPDVALPPPTRTDQIQGFVFAVLKGAVLGLGVVLATRALAGLVLPSLTMPHPWFAIAATVLGTDLVYYATHRWLGHGRGAAPIVRWFRKNHHVHHRIEHLDFIRGNISSTIDTAVTGFQVPAGLIAAALGLDLGATLVAYGLILMLQATHHLNHTLHLGPLRYVFMDNHAHKLHHCSGGMLVNHGALFSLWDLAFGTYFEDHALGANALHHARARLPIRWATSREA